MSDRSPGPSILELLYGAVGVGLIVWSVTTMPSAWYSQAGLLILLVSLATPFSIRLRDPVRLPAAMPVEMTAMLIAPLPVSVLIAAYIGLATSLYGKRPLIRTLFNIGNLALPNALGALALALLVEPWPQTIQVPKHLPAVALAILIRMVGNMSGAALLLHRERGTTIRRLLFNSITEEIRSHGVTLRLLPVLMALAYPTGGSWVFLFGALLLIAIGSSMQRYQERIDSQTLVDGLTNLGNRKAWEQFRSTLSPSGRHLVAVIDIDGLKQTNDTYGHSHGDAVIVDLATRLRSVVPELSHVFRIGGDEFVMILPYTSSQTTRTEVDQAVGAYSRRWREQGYPVSASVGFAACPSEAPDLDAAVRLADQRMYAVKSAARG